MEFGFIWFGLALMVGIYAARRGRSGTGWFLLAVLVSPLIAGLLCLALGPKSTAADTAPSPDTHVKCPDCRELVLRDARKCKHCGCSLIPQ